MVNSSTSSLAFAVENLKDRYEQKVIPMFRARTEYNNIHKIPRLIKITVNMGLGEAATNNKVMKEAEKQLELITGQKPKVTIAKKSNSTFKLREGMQIGCMVTLRKEYMYNFLTRLIYFALPRQRNFKGFTQKFDGRGSFNFGIKDQTIFLEIDYDKIDAVRGLNVTIVTSAKTDAEGKELLAALQIPFEKK